MARARPSPPPRPRGRPPGATSDATRARILRAARESFARTGYVATTNKDIADRAGITAAAIYAYFDSKTALFAATVKDAQAELVPRFRAAAEDAPTARDALRALLLASAELHANDPSLAAFLSALPVELQRHAEVAQVMAEEPSEVVAVFQGVVERGVRAGEIPKTAADQVLAMFIACNMGLSLYAAAIDGAHLEETVSTFVSMMDGKLFQPPRTRRGARTKKA